MVGCTCVGWSLGLEAVKSRLWGNNMDDIGVVICLCDLTGIFSQPWLDAGADVVLVDPQHCERSIIVHKNGAKIERLPFTINESMQRLGEIIRARRVLFVAGFPPCTDVAVSGAAHFEAKSRADKHFQAKAALVAEQCRVIGELSGAPWFFENPVSVFSSIFGPPNHVFHPHEFGGYLPEDDIHPKYPEYIAPRDAYPKKTCLWVGGGFLMPGKKPVIFDGKYSKQHEKLGGKSLKTKNIRSATPRGFAKAVFMANAPEYLLNRVYEGNKND